MRFIMIILAAAVMVMAGCATDDTCPPGTKVCVDTSFGKVVNVTDAEFEESVLKGGPVVVEFWAAYCPSCTKMHPVVERLADDLKGSVRVVMVDIKTNRKWAARYHIELIPTFIYYEDGKEKARAVGAMSGEALKEKLGLK